MAPKSAAVNVAQEIETLKEQGFAPGDKIVYKGQRKGKIIAVHEGEAGKSPMIEYSYKNAKVSVLGWSGVGGGWKCFFFSSFVASHPAPPPSPPTLGRDQDREEPPHPDRVRGGGAVNRGGGGGGGGARFVVRAREGCPLRERERQSRREALCGRRAVNRPTRSAPCFFPHSTVFRPATESRVLLGSAFLFWRPKASGGDPRAALCHPHHVSC